ncbi:MAG: hypothetical protein ACUVTP_10805 [Candidatus Fervidibacter sp.]
MTSIRFCPLALRQQSDLLDKLFASAVYNGYRFGPFSFSRKP